MQLTPHPLVGTSEPPAQKAYATIQNVQLHFTTARPPPVEEGESASPIRLSLSINEDPSLDPTPPTDGTLLLVSELPSSYCAADPLYDLFKPFGESVLSLCLYMYREYATTVVMNLEGISR